MTEELASANQFIRQQTKEGKSSSKNMWASIIMVDWMRQARKRKTSHTFVTLNLRMSVECDHGGWSKDQKFNQHQHTLLIGLARWGTSF